MFTNSTLCEPNGKAEATLLAEHAQHECYPEQRPSGDATTGDISFFLFVSMTEYFIKHNAQY